MVFRLSVAFNFISITKFPKRKRGNKQWIYLLLLNGQKADPIDHNPHIGANKTTAILISSLTGKYIIYHSTSRHSSSVISEPLVNSKHKFYSTWAKVVPVNFGYSIRDTFTFFVVFSVAVSHTTRVPNNLR